MEETQKLLLSLQEGAEKLINISQSKLSKASEQLEAEGSEEDKIMVNKIKDRMDAAYKSKSTKDVNSLINEITNIIHAS